MTPSKWLPARLVLVCSLAFSASLGLAHDGPYLMVLGTAQDGGFPQIGCQGSHCLRAKKDAEFRRLITSLLMVSPRTGQRWLIEATPDIRQQVERMAGHPPSRPRLLGRGPLFDGVFLTHAHIGHYTGLTHLGREAYGHPQIPVYGSERMVAFLKSNGPWQLLIEAKHILPTVLKPGQKVNLTENLKVQPLLVPHRDEFSDTFGYLIEGPNRKVLFIPDIDKWSRWDRDILDWIGRVDLAFLDGTFFAEGEIPGRAMAEIPHPFITESLQRFKSMSLRQRNKIHFIHFNHTNPVVDSESKAAEQVGALGMHLAKEMQIVKL